MLIWNRELDCQFCRYRPLLFRPFILDNRNFIIDVIVGLVVLNRIKMNHLLEQKRQRVPYGDVWNKPFIYLGITYCNAHLNKSFSKNLTLALHTLSDKLQNNLYVGDPLFDIYQGTSEVLMKSNGDVRSIVNEGQRKAVEKLNEYVINIVEGRLQSLICK